MLPFNRNSPLIAFRCRSHCASEASARTLDYDGASPAKPVLASPPLRGMTNPNPPHTAHDDRSIPSSEREARGIFVLNNTITIPKLGICRPLARAYRARRIEVWDLAMFQWSHEEAVPFDGSADALWAWWSAVDRWPDWDRELSWVRLSGPFGVGTRGRMKPLSGPEVAFTLTVVDPSRRFQTRAGLPFTTMVFDHVHHPPHADAPGMIRHGVTMRGLLAPLFGRLIGRGIRMHLRAAMLSLATCASQSPDGPRRA